MNPYIANTASEVQEMLSAIGVKTMDDLFRDILPGQRSVSFDLPDGKSEMEVVHALHKLADKNACGLKLFVGGGYYDHYIPPTVWSLASRGEFLTAYTPYQPECSQGTLQALYEFQSAICALTEMQIANASLYDGSTALYEAAMMAVRLTKRKKVVMDGGVSPIFRTILRSYTRNLSVEFDETPVVHGQSDRASLAQKIDGQTAAVILQNPNFFGAVDDQTDIARMAHEKGALVIVSVYPIALGVLKTPGEMDADIVTGEGQSLGIPLSFGGSYLGFMATRKEFVRQMPGRIVGETLDRQGRRCFVNTVQAREQHIRREKATSNICTNSSLNAIQAVIFLSLLGKQGLKQLALLNMSRAEFAKKSLEKIPGVIVKRSSPTFNEFTVCLPIDARKVVSAMIPLGYAAGFPLVRYYPGMENDMTVAVTEQRTQDEILIYADCLKKVIKGMQ